MSDYKLVPVESIKRAMYALERFANDTLAGRNSAHELRELLAAAPAVQGDLMLNGFRVMHLVGRPGAREGERWEIYAPCGSGGVVHEDEVADWVVRKLLDSLATSKLEDQREPVGFIRHVHYHGIARNSEECEVVLYDNAKNLPEGTLLYTASQPAEHPCPEDIREGAPYDDPDFESLCREHEIWGTAAAAQCAEFWRAGKRAAEQQPELAKYQPCGCVICTCEHETQCQGCGGHHCGTHPVGQIPGPVYQQPAPDVSALLEALELISVTDPNEGVAWFHEIAYRALAAHRKGAKP